MYLLNVECSRRIYKNIKWEKSK